MIAVLEVHDVHRMGRTDGSRAHHECGELLAQLRHLQRDQRPGKLRHHQHRERAVRQQLDRPTTSTTRITAIQSLRSAGYTHNLMVDAANWGQDWTNTMRNNATQIWNADSQRNLIFSVHMYEVYSSAQHHHQLHAGFETCGLPLVIGEFGADHQGQPVDEARSCRRPAARHRLYRLVVVGQWVVLHLARRRQQFRNVADELGKISGQRQQWRPADRGVWRASSEARPSPTDEPGARWHLQSAQSCLRKDARQSRFHRRRRQRRPVGRWIEQQSALRAVVHRAASRS